MFFETTYVPSPQLSATSTLEEEDDLSPPPLSPSLGPLPGDSSCDESLSEGPVDHLIFVIHGIGQQTEQYGHFYEHIENLRETTRQVLQAKVPDHAVRIELVPIEWHRHIHEQTDPTMNRITLKSIPTIRLIENEYLADILFYFSKERGQAIVDNVTHLFNTSYHNFLEKHPDFAGKIAIIGYSLGGIITYDILSHQRQPSTVQEENEYQKVDVKYSKLDFTPDYFFGFGSPLAAMLTIRNQTPLLYHPHEDIIFENVFHPFDPLAYRFEPLLNDYYTEQPAVLVERSIPLGPSFSFPSIPSFPGAGILSFFSWKASSQQGMMSRSAESIVAQGRRTTESMVANQEERDGKKFISSFNSFLQYFSSPSSSAQRKIQQEESWDNKQPEPTNPSELKRPVMRSRSKTFGSPKELRQTIVKPQRHHLVEVLGIDGVRMESFEERAQQNFPRQNEDKSLWSDLNQELNEPGPAITSPGQSKEDVTKDATQPSGSGSNAGESMAKQAEDAKQQTKLPGGRRIDHVLQPESFMSMIANEYLVGLRAHFSYWTNKDLLWHIVCRLEDLEEVQRKDPQEQPK